MTEKRFSGIFGKLYNRIVAPLGSVSRVHGHRRQDAFRDRRVCRRLNIGDYRRGGDHQRDHRRHRRKIRVQMGGRDKRIKNNGTEYPHTEKYADIFAFGQKISAVRKRSPPFLSKNARKHKRSHHLTIRPLREAFRLCRHLCKRSVLQFSTDRNFLPHSRRHRSHSGSALFRRLSAKRFLKFYSRQVSGYSLTKIATYGIIYTQSYI